MALPEDLLEQAQHLVSGERTRPRQASLRRALSTAYYSLFHLLISEATQLWKRPPVAFGHTTASPPENGVNG
jgi:hypothetical protein